MQWTKFLRCSSLQRLTKVVLLSAAVEVTCFARIVFVVRCVTQRYVSDNLSRRLRGGLRDKLRDRLHSITGLTQEHKCLPG